MIEGTYSIICLILFHDWRKENNHVSNVSIGHSECFLIDLIQVFWRTSYRFNSIWIVGKLFCGGVTYQLLEINSNSILYESPMISLTLVKFQFSPRDNQNNKLFKLASWLKKGTHNHVSHVSTVHSVAECFWINLIWVFF